MIEIPFDPKAGYPAGPSIRYECLRCGVMIPSMPEDSVTCVCRNVRIDADAGRVSVDDFGKFRVVRVDPKMG